jgi:hypothetical protein
LAEAGGGFGQAQDVYLKALLAHDADMDRLAGAAGIALDEASLRAT